MFVLSYVGNSDNVNKNSSRGTSCGLTLEVNEDAEEKVKEDDVLSHAGSQE